MTAKEYCIAYCKGCFYAQLGENLINGKSTSKPPILRKVA